MEDTLLCPICGDKLRSIKIFDKYLHIIGKKGNFYERTCTSMRNHSLQFFADAETKKIDFLRFSLDPRYTKYLEIDYINQKSRLSCLKESIARYIELPRVPEIDFPDLTELKEKVSLFIVFS